MIVPFSANDFLARALAVYAERTGMVDEPDQPAPSLGDLSYARIGELARAQAARLDQLGLGVGDRVAFVSHNAARLYTSFFGVCGSGRVFVPVNFRLSVDEVTYIVGALRGARGLPRPRAQGLAGRPRRRARLHPRRGRRRALRLRRTSRRPWEPDENATATINYTSGTTARPKGVQITHRNIWTNAVTFALHTGVTDRDVYLHTLPMFHANGWGMPFAMTGMGVPQVVIRKIDGAEILRRVEKHGVTVMCAAPAVVAAVLDAAQDLGGRDPRSWHDPDHRRGRPAADARPWPGSRPSWAGSSSRSTASPRPRRCSPSTAPGRSGTTSTAEERAAKLVRAGQPAIGVTLKIDDEGEVLARSNVILEGYWEQPEETAASLRDGWFHTGDGGVIGDDGYLTIQDRKKDVIITGGENVSSIEVEDAIFSHPDVAEVAVIGVPDEKWGETIKALVVKAEGSELTEQELIDHVKSKVARYKAPSSVEFRDVLARTATGKLQKYKLRQEYWKDRDRQVN